MKRLCIICWVVLAVASCGGKTFKHDASGTFEASQQTVAAEQSGRLETLDLKAGDHLVEAQQVGHIDSTQWYLTKMQLLAAQKVADARHSDSLAAPTAAGVDKARRKKELLENLLKLGAATQQQVNDADTLLRVLEHRLIAAADSSQVSAVSADAVSEMPDAVSETLRLMIDRVNDRLAQCRIINPTEGVVLNKHVAENEFVVAGTPLYTVADTRRMFLRVYVMSKQLDNIVTGQSATVFIAPSGGSTGSYTGKVVWISGKPEPLPNASEMPDGHRDMVYAVKIAVANTDNRIKIGTYGDVDFTNK